MKTRREQVWMCGIVAFAGIAILGWVREPEKHDFRAVPRAIFSPPPDDSSPVASAIAEKPTPVHESERAVSRPAHAHHRVVSATFQPTVATPVGTPSNVSKPEKVDQQTARDESTTSRDDGDRTASRGPETRQSDENLPEGNRRRPTIDRAEGSSRRSDPTLDRTGSQTPAVVGSRTRSTARSAAIIAGIAAAGAAIGGAADGGRGAAIGAISGAAGGFVYDRMTRRKDLAYSSGPANGRHGYGSGANGDAATDGMPFLFRTPGINGR